MVTPSDETLAHCVSGLLAITARYLSEFEWNDRETYHHAVAVLSAWLDGQCARGADTSRLVEVLRRPT